MGWTLVRGASRVARLELRDVDMPSFLCSFHAGPDVDEVEPLFVAQEKLLEDEDWDGAERLWAVNWLDEDPQEFGGSVVAHELLRLVSPNDSG